MKIYTKKGDTGNSRLYSNEILHKGHKLFNVLGALDELNVRLGMSYWSIHNTWLTSYFESNIESQLIHLQKNVIKLSSAIATISGRHLNSVKFPEDEVDLLEFYIDEMDKALPELTVFINPRMYDCCLQVHLCRTQCRTIERFLNTPYESHENIEIPDYSVEKIYINRLSDYFFNLARYLEHRKTKRYQFILRIFLMILLGFLLIQIFG